MASQAREKFATQVNSEISTNVRNIAQSEGRQFQALVDETLANLIEMRKQNKSRAPMSWPPIRRAMRNSGHSTKSSLNDGLPHRYRGACHS